MGIKTWVSAAIASAIAARVIWLDVCENEAKYVLKALRYLRDNPSVVAAFIAGLVAIVVARTTLHGVKLSLAATEDRSRREMANAAMQESRNREHSRDQAARERDHSLAKARQDRLASMRREVYLGAVTEMVKLNTLMGSLVNGNLPKLDLEGTVAGLATAVQRVSVVAEQPTAMHARELMGAYMRVFMGAIAKSIPLGGLDAKVTTNEDLRRQALERGAQHIEEMRQYNLSGRADAAEFAILKRKYDVNAREVGRLEALIDVAMRQKVDAQLEFGRFLADQLRTEIMSSVDVFLVAVRTELELKSDLAQFQAQSVNMFDQITESMEAFKTSILGSMADPGEADRASQSS